VLKRRKDGQALLMISFVSKECDKKVLMLENNGLFKKSIGFNFKQNKNSGHNILPKKSSNSYLSRHTGA